MSQFQHPSIFSSTHRLQLVPALDACLRQDNWLDQQAQTSVSARTSLRSCAIESQRGIFFPPGTHAEFSLQGKGYFSPSMASSVSAFLHLLPSFPPSPVLRPQEDHFYPTPPPTRHSPASCRALGFLSGTGNPAGSRLWPPPCPWDPRKPFLAQPPSPKSSKRRYCLYSVAPGSNGEKGDSKMSILGRLRDWGRWPGTHLEAVHSKQTTFI